MTLNLALLHLDAEYSKNTICGQRLVNSLFTLGLVTGIAMQETTQGTTLGNLGFRKSASRSLASTGTQSGSGP
jgi:acyl dehydratase